MIVDGVAAGSTQLPFFELETTMKPTEQLHHMGQSLWLDNITRGLLTSGTLERYIRELSITGLTSNPSIFDHAIRDTGFYDEAIRGKMQPAGVSQDLFFELALEDLTEGRRPVPADSRCHEWSGRMGVVGSISASGGRAREDSCGRKAVIRFGEPAEFVHQDSRNSERTLRD